MQNQERELITGLFGRLQPFEAQPRDGEAEALIKETIARQPAAPYLLVQTVLVQEQALKGAQERIAELEARVSSGGAAPAASGFLGSAPRIGPWGAQPGAQAPQAAPPAPATRSPLQAAVAPQAGGGGSFLRSAMATAAGVAGGALLFEGIRSMMGSNPFGSPAAAAQPSPLLPPDSQQQQAYAGESDGMADNSQDGDYDTASDDSAMDSSDDDWA
jgi:hypothetical protein